ncbi:MAG: HD domain-containing protein [Lachnospiraceae bacterium]|nr:HD domain-containing protein [Lachnospiraceae bacterium]
MKGDFYCRAVHSVLNICLDEQVCGKGCPCYCGMKEDYFPICEYEGQKIVEKDTQNPMDMWISTDKAIQEGKLSLFPKVKGLDKTLAKAYDFAANAHKKQCRKGTKIPYFTHILTAMNYAVDLTTNKEVLTAVILHDTVEDTETTLADIVREFGQKVAGYIAAESENKRPGIPARDTWEIRKQETIQHLQTAPYEVKMIVLADKAANAESLVREWRQKGDGIWQKFNQSDKNKQAWYYYSCAKALKEFSDSNVMKQYLDYLEELFGKGMV